MEFSFTINLGLVGLETDALVYCILLVLVAPSTVLAEDERDIWRGVNMDLMSD